MAAPNEVPSSESKVPSRDERALGTRYSALGTSSEPARKHSAELELFLLKLAYTDGRRIALEGNNAFLLDDPGQTWIVYTGMADVFAVPAQGGQAAGVRRHLFRAEVGSALFGVSLPHAGMPIGLLAAGRPGTQLLQVDLARLRELAAELEYGSVVAGLIDQWVLGLSQSLPRALAPKAPVFLEAEQETAVAAQETATTRKEVLWVAQRQGESLLCGRPELPVHTDGALLPLCRHTWLQALAPSRFGAATSEAALDQETLWAGLAAFGRLVLRAVAANQLQDVSADHDRLQLRTTAQLDAIGSTLAQSAALLDGAQALPAAGFAAAGADPLLAACRLVGQARGIDIRAPHGDGAPQDPRERIRRIAQASYIRTRAVDLTGRWWTTDCGPLLAFHAQTGHPLALLPRAPGHYDQVDPVARSRVPLTATGAAALAPLATMFYRPFPSRALSALDVLRLAMQESPADLRAVVVLGIVMGVLGLVPPIATGIIFDTLVPSADRTTLLVVGAGLLVLALSIALLQVARSIAMLRAESRMDAVVQAAIWDRLLSLPVPFFRDYSSGDLGVRAMGINTIREILSGTVLTTILSSLFSAFNLVLLFYYQAGLAWVALGLVAISVLVTTVAGYLRIRYGRALAAVEGEIAGAALQIIDGIAKFRTAGAEAQAFARWANRFNRQQLLTRQAAGVGTRLGVFNAIYPVLTTIVIFAAVGPAVQAGFTTGQFLAFQAAFGVLLAASLQISGAFLSILSIVPIYERAKPILRGLPEVDSTKAEPGELSGDIEISHVSFRYQETGPLVLKDVSLHIRPGEFVALVGPSGSGKSTLFRMLLGFERPSSGTIYYDGQDLAGLDPRSVRRQVGVVMQNGRLMAGDIFDNISAGSILTMEQAWEAARLAGLAADIQAMPMGLRTVISEGGGTLSGGQRQRLLIARALVKRPRILYFDEATSALDNQTQEIVSQSLDALQATRIVIAHRLSTIAHADRIYVLEDGRVVQAGTYAELADETGLFAELVKRQTL